MSKFVFTPELTKEDAQLIIDALLFQTEHQYYDFLVSECAEKIRTKELIKRLQKIAKLNPNGSTSKVNRSGPNLSQFWLVTLISWSLSQTSPAIANSHHERNSYYSTAWQTNYLCIPDDKYSMGIDKSDVGRGDFSSHLKFLVNFEDEKFRFKKFDADEWTELQTISHRQQYSYLDPVTHFSFFPFTVSRYSDAPTFKYDHMLFGAYTANTDLYMGISLVGSCSAIN